MKFFITALIIIAFGANAYSQNNTKITLNCGVTPVGSDAAMDYGIQE